MELLEKQYYEDFKKYNVEEWIKDNILNDPTNRQRFNSVIDLIPDSVKTLLDVGCHGGAFQHLLYDVRPISSVGLERSKSSLAVAKKSFNLIVLNGDVSLLPFKDSSFDTITALEILEHLPYGTFEKALAEIERVAKKWVIISVPYKEKRILTICPYCGCNFNSSYHLRSFDENKLGSLFNKFTLRKTMKIIPRTQPLFISPIRKIFGTIKPSFPEFGLCPACGYTQIDRGQDISANIPERTKFKKIIKGVYELIPKVKIPSHIVALYHKNE